MKLRARRLNEKQKKESGKVGVKFTWQIVISASLAIFSEP